LASLLNPPENAVLVNTNPALADDLVRNALVRDEAESAGAVTGGKPAIN
jgi:hypothetical protein